ncbi:MAG: hypothetical protein UR68_C0018G0012 [Candidatus Roizmanbacteria bacterium GW2011_GWA2_35_19]|uniref:Glycosyltransferase RgtA/B/C/D-like domain-containing protein n=2 Tax=Candidatus Roizmaniibacteriota TaxID=1752723 RepID=A0A0G0EYN1_9BACT|nr:MAG: hypothetical protein UR63_C0009G0007 [Candidatus Roizmanbacteria bacterium GW2011_GWC2_35_12]KKP72292.1 MAG: hypothetical protein UR68_C0018G0012 [Candidatus Roizmanbacteria bacterium GW2011_GWA2_35_19]
MILVLLSGIFLRFFRFEGFVTFLGDQGRDAIVIKRILSFEHFPAIGAPTSVGQVYLGPFYYYFIAPWLLIFRNNPLGPAFGVALFSCLYLLINYLILKKIFDKKTAIISTILLSFSTVLIDLSRFSWNPNLMPLFSLLTVYFLLKSINTNKIIYYLLMGSFLSFSIQLHYLALFLIPPIGIYGISQLLVAYKKSRNQLLTVIKGLLFSIFSFVFFSIPLIVFDLRHNFLNTNNFINLFKQSQSGSNKLSNLIDTYLYLNKHVFNFSPNYPIITIVLALTFVGFLILLFQKKSNIKVFLGFFLGLIFGFMFYGGQKHPHYFGVIYPFYFIIVGYFIAYLNSLKFGKILIAIFLITYIFLNSKGYGFLANTGDRQIERSTKIARIIYDNVKKEKFTVTALPEKYSDSTYRYFLEIWGKRSLEKDSLEKADELFVACEKKCKVIGDPQWDIAFFAPNKITGEWQVDNVRIYKLIR